MQHFHTTVDSPRNVVSRLSPSGDKRVTSETDEQIRRSLKYIKEYDKKYYEDEIDKIKGAKENKRFSQRIKGSFFLNN